MNETTASIIAVFPGQGSQQVGMGKDLYENFKRAKETFEEASDAIKLNLKKLCFDGPESDLTLTENTQPCLLTTSVAAFRVVESETGFKPKFAAGHSLGEYSALVAVGALPLAIATQWVRARGQAMQSAVPVGEGTMAAVLGLDDESVKKICELASETTSAWVEPANYNAPGQVAIAGTKDAVEKALALIKLGDPISGGKGVSLAVSAPFHSKLMKPAHEAMASVFTKSKFNPKTPQCPYFPNRTARPHTEAGVILDLLLDQIDHPVLWKHSIEEALRLGVTKCIEFGPGKVLTGLNKRIAQGLQRTPPTSVAIGDSSGIANVQNLLKEAPHVSSP